MKNEKGIFQIGRDFLPVDGKHNAFDNGYHIGRFNQTAELVQAMPSGLLADAEIRATSTKTGCAVHTCPA
jgi:hypothetical protein